MNPTSLFEHTYQFINQELLSLWNWPEIAVIFSERQKTRASNADIWVDVLPALTCAACQGQVEHSIPLAAAWSLYILAGRIMDDIQDNEGESHLWNREGPQQALPTALFVIGMAHTAMARLQPLSPAGSDILDAFGRVMAISAKAQREQASLTWQTLSVESYFSNLVSRTAVAFATAAWSGGRIALANPETLEVLYNYGMAVGIAIQIEDDCEDLVKSDLCAGLYTLPVIYALSQTQHQDHAVLTTLLAEPDRNSVEQVNKMATVLSQMNAFQWSRQMAGIYRVKAVDTLSSLPPELDTSYLREFALGSCSE